MAKIDKDKIISYVKKGGEIVGTCGTHTLICGLTAAVLPPQVSLLMKGGVLVGDLLVSSLVGSAVKKHIDETIDETIDDLNDTAVIVKQCVECIKGKSNETTEKEAEVG